MSKGPGRVQREIAALMSANPDGAWSTANLCEAIYPDAGDGVEKKHRVAVIRALRTMRLPDDWELYWLDGCGKEFCLFNLYSNESAIKMAHLNWLSKYCGEGYDEWRRDRPHHVESAIRQAAKRREWRDASEVERIDMRIAELRKFLAITAQAMAFGDRKAIAKDAAQLSTEISELKARKEALLKVTA